MEGLKEIVNRTTKIFRVAERELENKGDKIILEGKDYKLRHFIRSVCRNIIKIRQKLGMEDCKECQRESPG